MMYGTIAITRHEDEQMYCHISSYKKKLTNKLINEGVNE